MSASRKIFISYRRADTRGYAHAIYNILVGSFGENNVFMDVDTIRPGEDFVEILRSGVNACDVLLALIGPEWLKVTDSAGRRRLDDPNDFVRLEIESALNNGVAVIPVLLEEARMPSAADLPGGLKPLANRQAFIVGNHLASDVEKLSAAIRGSAGESPAANGSRIAWVNWFFLALFTIPPIFFVLTLAANFIWYYTTGYTRTGGNYQFIGLQPVIEGALLSVYLAASEGATGLVQWLVFLRKRRARASFWLISNPLIGLITGFGIDLAVGNRTLINEQAGQALLAVFGGWLIYNVILGPALIGKLR